MSQAPTPPSLTEDDNGTPRAVARSEGRGRAVLKTRSRVLATRALALAAAQLVLGGCPEQGAQGEAQPSSPVQTSQHHAGRGAAPPPLPAAAAEAAWALLRCQGPPWLGLEWVSQEAGVPCGPRRGGSPGSLCPRPSTATVRGALSDTQTGGSGDSGRPASSCWAGTQGVQDPKGQGPHPSRKEAGQAQPKVRAQEGTPGRAVPAPGATVLLFSGHGRRPRPPVSHPGQPLEGAGPPRQAQGRSPGASGPSLSPPGPGGGGPHLWGGGEPGGGRKPAPGPAN